MASGCCLNITKYFLFLFNLMFFLLGALLLSVGLWILLSDTSIFMPSHPYISVFVFSYLLIISGSVTMSLGFFGCLGSLMTVKCLLATYLILLTVLLAAQIMGGVLFYTQKTELAGSVKQHTLELIASFGKNHSGLQGFEKTLNYIQHKGSCCGWDGKEDWEDAIPCSCFYKTNVSVMKNETEVSKKCVPCSTNSSLSKSTCGVYERGCSENINEWLEENLFFIMVVILAISVVECLQWICLVSYCFLNRTHRCCPIESHGSHLQISRDFTVEYWQEMWCNPFDVSV